MIRTAVVGLGELGNLHAQALQSDPLAELVAVCDPDPARAQAAHVRLGVPAFAELSDLLADARPGLVCVCRSGAAGAADLRQALQAGAAALGRLPLAPTPGETAELVALAATRQAPLAAVLNHRFVPAVAAARGWVEQGRLGTILFAHISLWEEGGAGPEPFARFRATAGHAVDLLRHLCGAITEVQTFVSRPGRRDPRDAVNVNLRFASGAVGHLNYSPDMTTRHSWMRGEVAGNVARLEISNVYEEAALYPHAAPEKMVVTNNIWSGLLGYHQTYAARLHRLLEQLTEGASANEIEGSGSEALAAQEVVEAAVASAEDSEPRPV